MTLAEAKCLAAGGRWLSQEDTIVAEVVGTVLSQGFETDGDSASRLACS